MKNLDFRSVLIGILGSSLIFMLYGMRFQDENLGDIKVESLTVRSGGYLTLLNNEGDLGIILDANTKYPFISINNSDSKEAVAISSDIVGNGTISTYSSNGNDLVSIGKTEGGHGAIMTYSSNGTQLVSIGSNEGVNGAISTYSGEGNILVNITSTTSYDGSFSLYNRHGKRVVVMQGNKNADGDIVLYDRYGDAGWEAKGKQ